MSSLIDSLVRKSLLLLSGVLFVVVVGCGQRAATPPPTAGDVVSMQDGAVSTSPVTEEPLTTAQQPAAKPAPRLQAGAAVPDSTAYTDHWADIPRVEPDDRRQAASVAEAIRSGAHPERLTPHVVPAIFNVAHYRRDPAAYLAVVEPGRCHQMADTAPGVPSLVTVSPPAAATGRDGSIPLTVRTLPRAPVTFTTFDLGAFANDQISTTVQADDNGLATALWRPTPGTDNQVTVLAASPVVSEQAHFVLTVLTESRP